MKRKEIAIACTYTELVPLDEVNDFQGNLKDLPEENYRRLRQEIIDHGFSFPLFLWREPESGRRYALDGHQRHKAVWRMVNLPEAYIDAAGERFEAFSIAGLPSIYVEAADRQEAKHKLLAATSQYGKLSRRGLYDFVQDAGITFEDLQVRFDFSMDTRTLQTEFAEKKVEFTTKGPGARELGEEEFQTFQHECPRCAFGFND